MSLANGYKYDACKIAKTTHKDEAQPHYCCCLPKKTHTQTHSRRMENWPISERETTTTIVHQAILYNIV